MNETYSIKLTRAGLDYLRQVLGARPYDEVGALVANLELQRRQQDEPANAALPPAVDPPMPAKRGRPAKGTHAPSAGADPLNGASPGGL
jgi:hypothetical protein